MFENVKKLFQKEHVPKEVHKSSILLIVQRDYGHKDGGCHFRSYVYNRRTQFFDEVKSFKTVFSHADYRFKDMSGEIILESVQDAIGEKRMRMLTGAESITIVTVKIGDSEILETVNYFCKKKRQKNRFIKLD